VAPSTRGRSPPAPRRAVRTASATAAAAAGGANSVGRGGGGDGSNGDGGGGAVDLRRLPADAAAGGEDGVGNGGGGDAGNGDGGGASRRCLTTPGCAVARPLCDGGGGGAVDLRPLPAHTVAAVRRMASATAEAPMAARATAAAAAGMTRLTVAPDAGTPPTAMASAVALPVASPRRLPLAAPRQSRAAVSQRLRTTEKWAFTGTESAQPPPLGFWGPPLPQHYPPHAPHHTDYSHPDCVRRFCLSAAAPYSQRHAQPRTTKSVPTARREHEGTPALRKRKIPPATMRDKKVLEKEGQGPIKHRLERKCVGKKNPVQREKKTFVDYTNIQSATLHNVRSKQFPSVSIDVCSQVVSETLALERVLRLGPGVENSSHAGGGGAVNGITSSGRVTGGVNIGHSRSDAAAANSAAAARCRCPGGSSAVIGRPTTLSVPAARTTTAVPTRFRFSATISPRRSPTAAHKTVTTPLLAHVVQNTNSLERRYQLRHRAVAPRVQRHMEALHEDPKQPLNVLAKGLLQAIKRRLLLRRWFGVRRDEKRKPRVDTVD